MLTTLDLPIVALFLLGLVFMFVGAYGVLDVLAPLRWHRSQGKIVYSDMSSYEDKSSETGDIITMYEYRIEYTYHIDGRPYTNNQISRSFSGMATATSERKIYQAYLKRYPRGAKVSVFINPHNHQEALLERFAFWPLVMFLFFILWGVGCLAMIVFNLPIGYPSSGID